MRRTIVYRGTQSDEDTGTPDMGKVKDVEDHAGHLKRLDEASKRIRARGERVFMNTLTTESGIGRDTITYLLRRYPAKKHLFKIEPERGYTVRRGP